MNKTYKLDGALEKETTSIIPKGSFYQYTRIAFFMLLTLFLGSGIANAQTTLYSEDFTGQDGKGATGGATITTDLEGVNWTVDVSNAQLTATSDWFRVETGMFSARDVDGSQQPNGTGDGPIWISPEISINGYSNISISFDIAKSGTFEDPDFIKGSYQIDNGTITEFGKVIDDFTETSISVTGLTGGGSTLKVYVEMDNNAGTEILTFDNVVVTGTEAGPSVTLANTGSPAEGTIAKGDTDAELFGFSLTPSASIDFTAVTVTTSGTASNDDINTAKLVVDANNNGIFDSGETVLKSVGFSTSMTFDNFDTAQTGLTAETRYLVTGVVSSIANDGLTVTASIASTSDLTTTATSVTGSATGNELTIVAPNAPAVTASETTLTDFGTAEVNTVPRVVPTFTVSGSNLTADLVVTAPSGFQVSSGASFSSSVSLTPTGGSVSATTISVQFAPTSAEGQVSRNITVTSTGALDVTVGVSGKSISTEPTEATTVSFADIESTSMTINFPGGNGSNRVVFMKATDAVDRLPADGTAYTANTVFGSGQEVGTGNFVVYNGTGNSVSVTGFAAATTYHVAVHEYNVGTGDSQNYFTINKGVGSQATVTPPGTTVNFDTDDNWTASGTITSYDNHSFSESGLSLQLTNALRNGNSDTDGFPGALGTYSVRLRNATDSKALFTIASGGLKEFSLKVRRWDGSPAPDYTVRYSTDGGSNWSSLSNINGDLLTTSDWFTYSSGSINSGASNIQIEIANVAGERIMLDDFNWEGFDAGVTLTIANTGSPAASDINAGDNSAVLFGFSLTPSASIDFTGVTISVSGTAENADLENMRLVLDANSNGAFDSGETVVKTVGTFSSSLVFNSFDNAQTGLTAETRYLLVGGVTGSATAGRTLTASIANATDVVSTADTPTGTAIGNEQTIISASAPALTASTATLDDFGSVVVGQSSAEKTFTVEGANLTADLTVTAPTGFEISKTSGADFAETISFTPSSGTVATSTVYVRFSPGTVSRETTGNIGIQSTGATALTVAVSGTAIATEPTTASTVSFADVTSSSFTINTTGGNGENRIFVVKEGSAVNGTPVDGKKYTGNSVFGSGDTLAAGNFVVTVGDGNTVTVTGLNPSTTYHVAVFEYNGGQTASEVDINYNTTAGTASQATEAFVASVVISQYVENASIKAIEVLNVSGETIDFSAKNLVVNRYANGSESATNEATLNTGTLASGAVLVIGGSTTKGYMDSNHPSVLAIEDGFSYNGDDALELVLDGARQDVFGTIGTDPGSQWSGNGVATEDQNIQLKLDITTGSQSGWSDPSERFETVDASIADANDLFGFGVAPGQVAITGGAGYRFLASPTTDTYANFFGPVWTQGINGSDFTGTSGDANIFTYNGSSFTALEEMSSTMTPGQGVLAYIYADDDKDGTADSFPKYLKVSGTPASSATRATVAGNWLLAGNPYTVSIDSDSLDFTGFNSVVYVYDPGYTTPGDGDEAAANQGGSYRVWNGSTGSLTDGIISAYQGFWVQSTTGTSFSVNSNARSTNPKSFYKSTEEAITLELNAEMGELKSSAFFSFNDHAELGLDAFDGLKLSPLDRSAYLSLATLAEGTPLDIQNLPSELESAVEVPLSIQAWTPSQAGWEAKQGEITLTWPVLSNFPENWSLQLIDHQENIVVDVLNESSYSFTHTAPLAKGKGFTESFNPSMELADVSGRFSFVVGPITTSNEDLGLVPDKVSLAQNYPNPFNPSTTIKFSVPEATDVRVSVYDMLGREIAVLVQSTLSAGAHQAVWNATSAASGVYYYRLQAGSTVITKKMTLIK